ncbi:PDZ domain-containing protein [Marinicrinis sediminis]|uniref:PDZ domain-containing protein n=1 Tax=Marinicrinis sediminis TaxID=1652465 RepID=A0ABW5RA54_9BACL
MMEIASEVWGQGLRALLHLVLHPLYMLSILFVILQVRRQIYLERKMFHTKLQAFIPYTVRIVLWGILAGAIASIILSFLAAGFSFTTLAAIWILAMVMVLFQARYVCMAYGAGLLAVMQAVVLLFPQLLEVSYLGWWARQIEEVSVAALLALTAVLHIIEGYFLRLPKARMESPLFLEGKRGKIVGGYQVNGYWPVPLLLLVPSGSGFELPWSPLLVGDGWSDGMSLIAFPVLIGFGETVKSGLPAEKMKRASFMLAVYGLFVLGTSFLVQLSPIIMLIAGLLTVGVHEWMIRRAQWREEEQPPYFIHGSDGLKILAVIPGTPADKLGLMAGEIVTKVNGIPVRSKEQLHEALAAQSAFCKLEVKDHRGEVRFLQRAIYAGEHHQLGLILSPDEDAPGYVSFQSHGLAAFLKRSASGWKSRSKASANEHQPPFTG